MRLWNIFRRVFISRRCIVCDEPIGYHVKAPFCDICIEKWDEHLETKCISCGKTSKNCNCMPKLLKQVAPFCCFSTFYTGSKEDFSSDLILFNLKESNAQEVYHFCSKIMADAIISQCKAHGESYKDYAITYTPRDPLKVCTKGVDQARELAKYISKKLGIKLVHSLVNKGSKEQKKLSAEKRLENVKKAYHLHKKYKCEHEKLFLVDDVLTSGATMYHCAKLLMESGAKTIVPVTYCKDNIEKGDKNVKRNFKYYFTRAIKGIM